jgi:hypothetical protein
MNTKYVPFFHSVWHLYHCDVLSQVNVRQREKCDKIPRSPLRTKHTPYFSHKSWHLETFCLTAIQSIITMHKTSSITCYIWLDYFIIIILINVLHCWGSSTFHLSAPFIPALYCVLYLITHTNTQFSLHVCCGCKDFHRQLYLSQNREGRTHWASGC